MEDEKLIPVNNIEELNVGDRVKQIGEHVFGNDFYATITRIDNDLVWHKHDIDTNEANICFTPDIFLKVIKNSEVNQMEKAETQLEKSALNKAKKEVIERQIEEKATAYRDNMRDYITYEKKARDYRKLANEYADKLEITDKDKKELF